MMSHSAGAPLDTFWCGGREIAFLRRNDRPPMGTRGGERPLRLSMADARHVLRRRFAETACRARLVRALDFGTLSRGPAEVLRQLERMLEAGALQAWQLRARAEGVIPSREEAIADPSEDDTAGIGTHWIRVALVDMEGAPVASRSYRIELPGGRVRHGRLDAEGTLEIARHDRGGIAKLTLLDLDRDAWMRAGEKEPIDGSEYDGPEAGAAPAQRISARADDCFSSIAFRTGFFPGTLWDHEENRALRAERQNPSALDVGDVVYVPKRRLKQIECAMDAEHRLRRRGVPEYLTLRLLDADGRARGGVAYELRLERDEPRLGRTDASGSLTEPIPPDATRAELIVRDGERVERRVLRIGRLTPARSPAGLQSRLRNLGAYGGPLDGDLTTRASRRAIERFCRAHRLPPDLPPDALLLEVAKAHERV